MLSTICFYPLLALNRIQQCHEKCSFHTISVLYEKGIDCKIIFDRYLDAVIFPAASMMLLGIVPAKIDIQRKIWYIS